MAVNRVFVDTNILVYANLAQSPFHSQAVHRLRELEGHGCALTASRQVLREYLAVMSRPDVFTEAIPLSSLIMDVKNFAAGLVILDDTELVTCKLLELIERFSVTGKQVHDANIVATMLVHDLPTLLTHNTKDFTRYHTLFDTLPLVI
jgi:predicted nucleic acid-binding protein